MDTEHLMLTLCEFLDLSKNVPIKDVLYDAFRQAITLGRVPAGTAINEKQLAQALHISRTPIRAALDQLASDRLVDRKPGSGVTVRGISKHDAEEVYEIRVVLEVLATTKAARNMNDDDFEALRQLLEEGQRMNAANDVDGVVRNWDEFNQFIFKMADSPRLQSIIEPLQAYTRYFRNVSARPEIRRNEAMEEHWGIYLAMRFGPEKKIEQVVRTHLRNSYGLISAEMADCGIK
ncbi:GntR family transcriptional regulator [Collinsella tanakaei]|uniref:GntR family transcriptional regulator n=1 Tax=Collinsella tanakaei TaxID=626935 RepID=UPI00195A4820|nr:GntR family transcriptional regulator [Collinsella tanakaei]MBM6755167.1 GntR family transcriptional regulator [Collinsella tanakaei]MBM6868193.1 GntR family transcriptional regulator [Collinsella tanakaei]